MLPMYGGANQGNPQGRDMFQDLKDWWNGTGLFTKSLAYSTLVLQILSYILPVGWMFVNSTQKTILGFQLWRPFTAGLVHSGIIELLICYLMVLPVCAVQEKQWGTLKTAIDFIVKNFEIHMGCNIFFLIVGMLPPFSALLDFPTYGLWCFFIVNLSQQCLANPDGVSRFCCLPFQIPNKWYPLTLIAIFSLLGMMIRFDMLMGYLVAYAHCNYLDDKYLGFLNVNRMSRWADLSAFSWMKNRSDYVDPTGNNNVSEGFSGQSAGQSIGGGIRGPQQSQQPAQQTVTQPVKSFAGRGVAIGGVDPNDRAEEGGILDRVNQPKAYNKLGEEEDEESGHFDLDSQATDAQSK